LRACGPETSVPAARANEALVAQPPARPATELPYHPSRLPSARVAIAASVVLLCSVSLTACGGGSNVSDAVPKSTPDIIPPTDTSAEKAAVQTTSTSTTSTAKSSEGASDSSSEEAKASEEASSSGSSESGSNETAKSGGAEPATKAGSESAATPSGGASAPSG